MDISEFKCERRRERVVKRFSLHIRKSSWGTTTLEVVGRAAECQGACSESESTAISSKMREGDVILTLS